MKGAKILAIFAIIIIILGIIYIWYITPLLSTEENQKPDAIIEINRSDQMGLTIHQGEEILFSAKNSSDQDGNIEKYQWNFGDGTTSNKMNTKHTYDEPGTYNVTLTVEDDDGNKDIKYLEITVNSLPVAKVDIKNYASGTSITIPFAKKIQFNANDSFDDDGWIESYHWDFGDGNISTLEAPEHYYFQLGFFRVTLTIQDNDGGIASDQIDIEIVKRTYDSEWTLNYHEVIVEGNGIVDGNGYTVEGQSTDSLFQINQNKIARINISLNWTDHQPLLMNNQSEGEDTFELRTVTPENITMIENSTSGNISIVIPYNSKPLEKYFRAKTESDAISMAEDDAKLSDGGNGEWYLNISAIECKGGNWINEQFDLDLGNAWTIRVIVFYYELEMHEIVD